jgi:hypothetical protein
VLPWPARAHRRAAIEQARAGLADRKAELAQAEDLSARIQRYASDNHFSDWIAGGLGPPSPR